MAVIKIKPSSYQDIADKYANGLPLREIAQVYHVHPSTVQRILNKLGIERRSTGRYGGESRFPMTYEERLSALKTSYGLLESDIVAIIKKQDGRCPICERKIPGKYGPGNHVDHCHNTGAIRGLLCNRCNVGIGFFNDDGDMLRRAAEYIETSVYTRVLDSD